MTAHLSLPESIGRYQPRGVLGSGGFATVVRAYDDRLDADVAIKILHADHAENPDTRARFLREARLQRRVSSPHVVTVHDVGILPDGRPFLVMEYATGGSFERRVSAGTGVDRATLPGVVEALAGGLAALHAVGVVHRDLKPANLLVTGGDGRDEPNATVIGNRTLTDGERLLIGDLGLAKDQLATSVGPTVMGGTPRYQSPEQRQLGAEITPATDTFAACGVLWFCLTGDDPPPADELPVRLPTLPPAWAGYFERGLAEAPEHRFASANEWHEATAAALDLHVSSVGPAFRSAEPGATCPYKGLAAFQPEDSGLFFGRDEMIEQLTSRLLTSTTLVIGGPSGSGKSSLLRAGLIPALRRGAITGSENWEVVLFTPGNDALDELCFQLGRLSPNLPLPTVEQLAAAPQNARRWLPDERPVLLAIDQFEELFTLTSDEEARNRFLGVLDALTSSSHSRLRLTLALRADFYAHAARHPWLADRINASQLLVGPMRRNELREAIERPAQRMGLRLEPDLTDTILDDLGSQVGSLPLLGHALMETWLRRRGNTLTAEGYRAAGGVGGAIAHRAEETYRSLAADQHDALRRLMLQLTTPGEGAADTRRRVRWESLRQTPKLCEVAEILTDSRLLTADDETVEIAHEALLSTWPRLARWIDESRDALRTRQRIAAAADEWVGADRNGDLLYRGTALAAATEWDDAHTGELGEPGRSFLEASKEAEVAERSASENEVERRRKVRHRAVAALSILAVAALVSAIGAFFALGQARDNERQAETATARALAAAAVASATNDPLLATALAVESMSRSTPPTAEARGALVTARSALAERERRITPLALVRVPESDDLTISPDGSLFAVGDKTGGVSLFDSMTRENVLTVQPHSGGIQAVAFDPSGRFLASTGNDGTVVLLEVASLLAAASGDAAADEISPFAQLGGTIGWDLAFSPDSRLLAVGTETQGVQIYDVASRARIDNGVIERAGDYISVAFSADGSRLIIGRGDGIVEIRDAANAFAVPVEVAAHPDGSDVWETVPAPNGGFLTTRGTQGITMWDPATGAELGRMTTSDTNDSPVIGTGVAVTPDSQTVLAGRSDGRIVLARASTDGQFAVTETTGIGHELDVVDGALSADGRIYATLGADQMVRLWLIDKEYPDPAKVLAPAVGPASALAVSPDGETVALGDIDGRVRVLDSTGTELVAWNEPRGVRAMTFVGDASVVTGDDAGGLSLWRVSDGSLIASVTTAHSGSVLAVASSDGGGEIVSTGKGGAVRIWSGAALEPIGEASPHQGEGRAVAVIDGEDTVVSVGGGVVQFADSSGDETRQPMRMADALAVAVHPGGRLLAVGDQAEAATILDLDDGDRVLHSLPGHEGGVRDLAFVEDGTVLAVLSNTGRLRMWDTETGVAVGPALELGSKSAHLAVSDSGIIWLVGSDLIRFTAFDETLACDVTAGVFDSNRRDVFLGGDELRSCRPAS